MGSVSEVVAILRAHLLIRGHHEAAPSGGEEVPDYGPHVEKDYVQCPPRPQGT